MKLPILMFHKVAEMPAGARYPGNYVAPALFDELLGSLRRWGYESVAIDDWLLWRDGAATMPKKPIVFTFDDGYRTNREIAWPLLQQHGFTGTIFLVSDLLGQTNRWDPEEIQEPLLSMEDVRVLRREGMRFGSHTRSHAALTRVGTRAALEEMRGSRWVLEDLLGEPVRTICYPYSKQNQEVRQLAQDAGYSAGVRGLGRLNSRSQDPFELRRIKIDNRSSPGWLRRELARLTWLVFW